jgi:hypothetical protein
MWVEQINVPGHVLDEVEAKWAPPDDPIFDLIPRNCVEHISSAYAQIRSPEVNFDSFWDVYNNLRDAVVFSPTDLDSIPQDGSGELNDEPLVSGLPFSQLQECEFGANGIPSLVEYGGVLQLFGLSHRCIFDSV